MLKCYASGGSGTNTNAKGMSHAEAREHYKKQRESNRIDYSGQPTPKRTLASHFRSQLPGYDQYGRPVYKTMLNRGNKG